MDYNLLVGEILARVSEKLSNIDRAEIPLPNKPKLLILTEHHGTICHDLLENTDLQQYFHIDCALQNEYNCDVQDYTAVILYNLSITALGKLASGICDTPFIRLASQAILMGKKIFVPVEEVELYQYKHSAPNAYYTMMNEKLKLLYDSGVAFCKKEELMKQLIESNPGKNTLAVTCNKSIEQEKSTQWEETESASISKKVITESDVRKLFESGIKRISINSNAILTDLAKDFIHVKNIKLDKETSAGRKPGKSL